MPHREVIVQPYRFFYRAVGKIVWVVAVWHGAQIPEMPNENGPANKGMQPTAQKTRRG